MVKGDRRFFGLMAISNQSAENIDKAIDRRAMPRVLMYSDFLFVVKTH